MKVLIFGGGGIADGISDFLECSLVSDCEVVVLEQDDCNVCLHADVRFALDKHKPDAVVNCAGISRPNGDYADIWAELETNLMGSIIVAEEAMGLPTVLIASVAALQGKPEHVGYAASKAGVISVARSYAAAGHPVWAISPGRVDTPMREKDYPNDEPGTRVNPLAIGAVVRDILDGQYKHGANVIVRKVGTKRSEVYEEPRWELPSLL